jgi:hypothetical protein
MVVPANQAHPRIADAEPTMDHAVLVYIRVGHAGSIP